MEKFRCPACNIFAIRSSRVFDGRILFSCSKCNICAIIPVMPLDDAYLEFLDRFDSNRISTQQDLNQIMQQENIIRTKHEVDNFIKANNVDDNELIKSILYSQNDYIVDYQVIEESPPQKGCNIEELPVEDSIVEHLRQKEMSNVYRFQQEAIYCILKGNNTIISAPTASGKTEAFCIPILQKIHEHISGFGTIRSNNSKKIHAILIYPTKALARDQYIKIKEMSDAVGIFVDLFDGETKIEDREKIINSPPDILITNFDIIHYHLYHKTRFASLLRSASFLVIDEAHVYTGIFGSNIHYIIKRLERITLKKKLQIIASSATLPNATEFCTILLGRKMELVSGSGRKGKIHFMILFPSLRNTRSLTLDLLKKLTKNNHKTIVFNNSHIGSELLAFYASKQGIPIKVHRAGLLPSIRAITEKLFKSGKIKAISSTPTLEIGIDIGDVDAVLSNIVPINRLSQRFGRAARRGQEGYAFLTLGNDPISQYYRLHPEEYLQDKEHAYTDPENPIVKQYQVLAMACDKPISATELESLSIQDVVKNLLSKGLLHLEGKRYVPDYKLVKKMLNNYSIRGIGQPVDLRYTNKSIGERSLPQALDELHDGAIYFIAGKRYQVNKLHLEGSTFYADLVNIPYDYPYYTKPIVDDWPSIIEIIETKIVLGIQVQYCTLKIRKKVMGYVNIELGHDFTHGKKVMLPYPLEYEFITKGFVFRAPRPFQTITDSESKENIVEMSGYHATEHVIIEGSSMITGGASQDLGGISLGSSGLIFIYDGSIGGNGASRSLYDRLDRAFFRALRILSECPCKNENGCPRCTFSYRCGNNNEYLHKYAAIEVLQRISNKEFTNVGLIEGERALV